MVGLAGDPALKRMEIGGSIKELVDARPTPGQEEVDKASLRQWLIVRAAGRGKAKEKGQGQNQLGPLVH